MQPSIIIEEEIGFIPYFRWLFLMILLGSSTVQLRASEGAYQSLSSAGLDLAYNLQFKEATDVFNQLIRLQPDNPHGYLLQSVNYYYRYQLEENHKVFGKQFQQFVLRAVEKSKRSLTDPDKKINALFYTGTAFMYLAAYHGWESEWLKAYWYGRKGIEYLERVVQEDSTYYDAYLGLGLYHYYTDIIPRYAKPLTFVLGIENNREKGLQELQLAAKHGTYSKAEALLFLGTIFLYLEKDYDVALNYFEALAKLYPQNASFLMLLGENYQKLNRNKEALNTLNQIVKKVDIPVFPVLVISSYYRIGNLYLNMKNPDEAINNYEKSMQYASLSTGNVKWVFALSNLNIGRSYETMGKRQEAVAYYKKVKRSHHKHAYEIAQKRLEKAGQGLNFTEPASFIEVGN